MFEQNTTYVAVTFAKAVQNPTYLESVFEKFLKEGKVHISLVSAYGIRFVCADEGHAEMLLRDLKNRADFMNMITRSHDGNNAITIFAALNK